MKPFPITSLLFTIASCLSVLCSNGENLQPTNVQPHGMSTISGNLTNPDGKPAPGVAIKLLRADYTPATLLAKQRSGSTGNADNTTTDAAGEFSFSIPDTGTYNIIGDDGKGNMVFIDSIHVADTTATNVDTAVLKPYASLKGITHLAKQNDTNQIRVTIFIPGTPFITKPDIGGSFLFDKIPEGDYRLFIDPTLDNYNVRILEISLVAGNLKTLDTIVLPTKSDTIAPDTTIDTITNLTPLVAHYSFDNESGAVLNDASGNKLSGTISLASRADGKIGKAINFANNQARCEIPSQGDFSNKISIDAWIKPARVDTGYIIGSQYYGLRCYKLELTNGKLVFSVDDEATWITLVTSINSIAVDTWTHLCVSYDGETSKVYLNGSLDNQNNLGIFTLPICYNDLLVGLCDNSSFGYDHNYVGMIDELRIWRKVLTDDEILLYYDETK